MNEMQIFSHSEFGEIGVITIDEREYFPATACAKILGYTNPHKAIKDHCRYLTKREVPHPQSPGKTIDINFIPESDLYRLVTHSKLPAAEKFERWVFEDVLPSIRKHGYYSTHGELPMDKVMEIVQQTTTAVMREVINRLIPSLTQMSYVSQPEPKPKRRRTLGRTSSIIGQLCTELRQEVEDMIISRRYTYAEIVAYFNERHGVVMSISSIGRYAKQLEQRCIDL